MKEFFNLEQAAKVIMNDMIQFNIGFDMAWANYNNEWFNNSLSEAEKDAAMDFIIAKSNKYSGDIERTLNEFYK